MNILIVEDSPTDRQLLKYLLEAKFKGHTIIEAQDLRGAFRLLERVAVDCVVLDLHLPDSSGKETFHKMQTRFPCIPIVIMTHNRDNELAVIMVSEGAADYITKNFTNEDDICNRIMFAVEKSRHTIKVGPEGADSVRRIEEAKASLLKNNSKETNAEITAALADLTQRTFTEIQRIALEVAQLRASNDSIVDTVQLLDSELVRGQGGRPSMRSQLDLLEHRVNSVEKSVSSVKDHVADAETTQKREAIQITQEKMSNRTKVLLGILTLVGILVSATTTYLISRISSSTPKPATTVESK